MGRIYYIMGKSSAGKDTLFREIRHRLPELRTVIPYTTRPIREGEENGREYHFVEESRLAELEAAGRVIEMRAYHTVHGVWKYFTVDDGQIDVRTADYLMIGTLESYEKMREYYGAEFLAPIYIEVEAGERLSRALGRERMQKSPKYGEMCRRFLADEKDFAEENLYRLGITRRFINDDKEQCLEEIIEVIHNGKL